MPIAYPNPLFENLYLLVHRSFCFPKSAKFQSSGTDPEIFERGGPEAIPVIYKIHVKYSRKRGSKIP